jgi:2-dehydro-3-deoxyphosphooctonate aldolase (KDO 8-P synthase)
MSRLSFSPPLHPCSVGKETIGGEKLVLIAGPCMAESYEICAEVASHLGEVCARLGLGYIFKASFDKANRTSAESPRGPGMEKGLEILREIKERFQVPVTTDVHLPEQAPLVAQVVDLLQVPAFLCRQTDLLESCACTGKPVNVKKGQFLAPWDVQNIIGKLVKAGAKGIVITERGTTFGYNNLVVDMAGLPLMRSFGYPVCFDATHSAQKPGGLGNISGGARESIPYLAFAAVAVGVDALFMEVHPDPEKALSDPATQWPLSRAEEILGKVARLWEIARS